jgi:hypothetical protein
MMIKRHLGREEQYPVLQIHVDCVEHTRMAHRFLPAEVCEAAGVHFT